MGKPGVLQSMGSQRVRLTEQLFSTEGGATGRMQVHSWVRKTLWSRKWQPSPVSLPVKSHGQRTLVSYSLQGLKEMDTTGHACRHTQTQTHTHTFPCSFSFHKVLVYMISFKSPNNPDENEMNQRFKQ